MSRVRDHWSIGEVLSLLQDEFPEVTISKIRFLESQGLIDPERTPSGYRKFSDGDYDRLYWILEQQRDHYLPLRVIRDRLEEGQDIGSAPRRSDLRIGDRLDNSDGQSDDNDEPETSPVPPQAPEGYDQPSDPEAGLDGLFSDAMAEVTGPVVSTDVDDPHPVRDEASNSLAEAMGADKTDVATETHVADEHKATDDEEAGDDDEGVDEGEGVDDDEGVGEGETAAAEGADQAGEDAIAASDPDGLASDDDTPPDSDLLIRSEPPTDDAHDEQDGAHAVTEPKPAPRLLGTRSEAPRPTTRTTAQALAPPPRPSLPGSSVALTREELAEQSGTTPGMIAELEKYGMVSPRQVGGAILFDSTALTVARLAVQFGRYGLEPRHLKTFRLGAEREVALLTQSIGPTLKANNPETRRRSYDTLQDLAELSASLRSIIVRDLVADLEPGG